MPLTELIVNPGGFAWFLWTLFFISLITLTLDKLFGSTRWFLPLMLTVVVLVMGSAAALSSSVMGLKHVGTSLQYFVVGYLVKRYSLTQAMQRKHLLITVPLFLSLVIFWQRQDIQVMTFMLTGMAAHLFRMLVAYLACYSFWVAFMWQLDKPTLLIPFGMASLGIYLLHFRILDIVLLWHLPLAVTFVIVAAVSYVAVQLIRKSNYLKPLIGEKIEV